LDPSKQLGKVFKEWEALGFLTDGHFLCLLGKRNLQKSPNLGGPAPAATASVAPQASGKGSSGKASNNVSLDV